jgi:hypothetical protein
LPRLNFQFVDDDGSVIAAASEPLTLDFSMREFLNKTIPGLQSMVNEWFRQDAEGDFVPHFTKEEESN